MAQITLTYVFTTALRGFHVYRSEWKPYIGQNITFKQEFENPHDRFAVAGKANLPGKLCAVSVGHVPREMSRHVWYAITEGAEFSATVKSVSPKPSPLKQGGLEIIITMAVKRQNPRAMEVLILHVEKVSYPEYGVYSDDSAEILKEIVDNPESESEGSDVELDNN